MSIYKHVHIYSFIKLLFYMHWSFTMLNYNWLTNQISMHVSFLAPPVKIFFSPGTYRISNFVIFTCSNWININWLCVRLLSYCFICCVITGPIKQRWTSWSTAWTRSCPAFADAIDQRMKGFFAFLSFVHINY